MLVNLNVLVMSHKPYYIKFFFLVMMLLLVTFTQEFYDNTIASASIILTVGSIFLLLVLKVSMLALLQQHYL